MAVSIPMNGVKQPMLSKNQGDVIFVPHTFVDSYNKLYYGDNLDVLRTLVKDDSVCGKVKLIYIDPPYSTGGIFQTRNLKDAYNDNLLGADYLEFMHPRLVLMHQLLSEEGSIYVHLDNKMVFHIKIMLDEIFGAENFQGMITRKKCKPKNYTRKSFGNVSDYILFYTKSQNPTWNRPYDEWTDEKILKEYPFIEETTGRRYKKVPIHAPGVRNGATGQSWKGMLPPPGKHWQYTPETLDEMDRNGEIYWSSNGNPRRKVYLENSLGIPVQDIWLDYLDINNQNTKGTGYPTEKNADMLQRIIEASSNRGDIVLDCFAGSGSTLSAAGDLGRNWIGADNSEESIYTIFDRFLNGVSALGDFVSNKNNGKNESLTLFDTEIQTDIHSNKKLMPFNFLSEPNAEMPFIDKIKSVELRMASHGS